ncbi:MAG: hypothetical protein INR69_15000 [Mucilaginibacter polytrichastri]|nr:hypothetical protein [Mucilaginibacter polytrichastri]
MPEPVPFQKADTIDEVIDRLQQIIDACMRGNSCAGYFPVLYHRVTCRIREGILKKEFDDQSRMERLDVIFANRYLEAWHRYRQGKPCSLCWKTAFDATIGSDRIIMQHLLLGINAHINLDLGIAAAETMTGFPVEGIKRDFDRINAILSSLVDEVQEKISRASPMLYLLNLNKMSLDDMLVRFSINTARNGAWCFATELSEKKEGEKGNFIHLRDDVVARLGNSIAHPFPALRFTVGLIRRTETRNIGTVIRLLQD